MAKKTPPLYAKGRYTLKSPWSTNPAMLYTCIAIRSFKDIYQLGYDVAETFYAPMGLIEGAIVGGDPFHFQDEVNAVANIITLQSDNGVFLYVPDTYILSYPDMGEHHYSHCVLSLSLGALPDYLDLASVKDAVAGIVAQHFGVVPTINEHRASSTTNPTSLQHEALEAARIGAITLLETDHAKALRLEARNTLLEAKVAALTAQLQQQ